MVARATRKRGFPRKLPNTKIQKSLPAKSTRAPPPDHLRRRRPPTPCAGVFVAWITTRPQKIPPFLKKTSNNQSSPPRHSIFAALPLLFNAAAASSPSSYGSRVFSRSLWVFVGFCWQVFDKRSQRDVCGEEGRAAGGGAL